MVAMSTSSINICPESMLIIRKRAKVTEDFPAPVCPTMPTFSLAFTLKLKSFKTKGSPSRYLALTSLNCMVGIEGQAVNVSSMSSFHFASFFVSVYSCTLSTATMFVSILAVFLSKQLKRCVTDMAYDTDNPINPGVKSSLPKIAKIVAQNTTK
eukprot:14414.XXX_342715_343173_1 [CDS] Oithona nana genome sequencing.